MLTAADRAALDEITATSADSLSALPTSLQPPATPALGGGNLPQHRQDRRDTLYLPHSDTDVGGYPRRRARDTQGREGDPRPLRSVKGRTRWYYMSC